MILKNYESLFTQRHHCTIRSWVCGTVAFGFAVAVASAQEVRVIEEDAEATSAVSATLLAATADGEVVTGPASTALSAPPSSLGERVSQNNRAAVAESSQAPVVKAEVNAPAPKPVVAAEPPVAELPSASVDVVEPEVMASPEAASLSSGSGSMSAAAPAWGSQAVAPLAAVTAGAAISDDAVVEEVAESEFDEMSEEGEIWVPQEAVSDSISLGYAGVESLYEFDHSDGEFDEEAYRRYMYERFVRPGFADSAAELVPYRAIDRAIDGFLFRWEAGMGYDSNNLLSSGGYSSPTFQDTGDRGGWVSWFRLGLSYSNGVDDGQRRFIYGFDLGGDIIAYEKGTTEYGRGNVEPYISPYIGYIGGKTTIRLSASYYLSEGNNLYGSNFYREAPVAESQTYGLNLSITRQMDRGTLSSYNSFRRTEFDTETQLNDQDDLIGDLSYLYNPPSMPKTGVGFGMRYGVYDTDRNPDEYFYEPGIRLSYQATSKVSLDGRVGYAFRHYDDESVIGNNGRWTHALGANWLATPRTRLRVEGYRDFAPSYVSAGESFNNDGVRLTLGYASPWWRLNFSSFAEYERAKYYSNVTGAAAGREDDFFRFGASVGRPLNLVRWMETSISLFYDFSENDSSDREGSFSRHFGGIRLIGTL